MEAPVMAIRRNEHMTFRANMGVGRHGWLRLTPAYGVRLVREKLERLPAGSVVTDPFSGTGTTPLAAAELGLFGQSVDVNPFLVWMGNMKMRNYAEAELVEASSAVDEIAAGTASAASRRNLWQPNLFKIERWWTPGALRALSALRMGIDQVPEHSRDVLEIALCRTLIGTSAAAFNHQSMSFKSVDDAGKRFVRSEFEAVVARFKSEASEVIESARLDLLGSGRVVLGDSRGLTDDLEPADLVLTSPPYVNRMSYIRELRPYMYWLRYLDAATDAGDLDWKAIGGTWGTATSKVGAWAAEFATPVDAEMRPVCDAIRRDGAKNGPLLANYVHKYHHDMWEHFQALPGLVKPGGEVSYIIGNSTFYGHEVPAQQWYARMLDAAGFVDVEVETIRKRNSNKRLFEYDVRARRP